MGRFLFILIYMAMQVWMLLYAGIGYSVLMGYILLLVLLVIPVKSEWLDSKFGQMVYGKIVKMDLEIFIRSLSKSKSYRITMAITSAVLLAVSVVMIVFFNYRLIGLFE